MVNSNIVFQLFFTILFNCDIYIYCGCGLVAKSCPTLCDPMDCVAHQAPLPMGFSRQEYWSGLPFPSPGDLPDQGIKPGSHIYIYIILTFQPF